MTAAPGTEEFATNLALGHLGQPEIALMSDGTTRARKARQFFPVARRAMLRRKPWNFATAWIQPAADPVAGIGQFKNRFPLPSGCLAVRYLRDVANDAWAVESGKAEVSGVPVETMILVTNEAAPTVCYTRDVPEVRLWDDLFLAAFGKLLASMLATSVGKSQSTADKWAAAAEAELSSAATIDAKEQSRNRERPCPSWVSSRRRSSLGR